MRRLSFWKSAGVAVAVLWDGIIGSGAAQAASPSRQTEFGSEVAVRRPVKLPQSVLAALRQGDRAEEISQCLAEDGLVEGAADSYFAASALDLNGDGRDDLVVTSGRRCLQGAHAAPFWIFLNGQTGYRQVFEGVLDGLTVLKAAHQGMRDLKTMTHTAVMTFFVLHQWRDGEYRPAECWWLDAAGKRSEGAPEGWESPCGEKPR